MSLPFVIQQTINTLSKEHITLLKYQHALCCVATLLQDMGEHAQVVLFEFEEQKTNPKEKKYRQIMVGYALFYQGQPLDFKGNQTLEDIARSFTQDLYASQKKSVSDPSQGGQLSYRIINEPIVLHHKISSSDQEYLIWQRTFQEISSQNDKDLLQQQTASVPARTLKSRL
jgi:hypothetical protein